MVERMTTTKYEQLTECLDAAILEAAAEAAEKGAADQADNAYRSLAMSISNLRAEQRNPDVAEADKASDEFIAGVVWALQTLLDDYGATDAIRAEYPVDGLAE
jgi:hypothetical protein